MRSICTIVTLSLAGQVLSADPVPDNEQIAATLVDKLDDPDEEVRQNLAVALARLSPDSLPKLTLTLRDHSADRRAGAALALALVGPPARAALPDLLQALSDESSTVRRQASFAISRILPGRSSETRSGVRFDRGMY